jgi:anti-sigma factor RsiW
MNCDRSQELLSDHYEGSLDRVLAGDLEAHLASCEECRSLRELLPEVVRALGGFPDMEAPEGLAARVAAAAWGAGSSAAPRPAWPARPPHGLWLAAAMLAAALGGGLVLTRGTALDPGRAAKRFVERSVDVGVYLAERKDRLVEDVRLLRVVIGTAFEGRIERVNDRVDDYKRLIEKRRDAEREQRQRKNGAAVAASAPRAAGLFSRNFFFQNPGSVQLVERSVTRSDQA